MIMNYWSDTQGWKSSVKPTALLVLANGQVIEGFGVGRIGETAGELCFNTAMTGYQEILTDSSYCGQIITFTFPHIGNTGTNDEDLETPNDEARGAVGAIFQEAVTAPSNWRSTEALNAWLEKRGIIAITGIDTRSLTRTIRDQGMCNAVLAHAPSGEFDREALIEKAKTLSAMEGLDLVPEVTVDTPINWQEGLWKNRDDYETVPLRFHVVALDFGLKTNILRHLSSRGCKVSVVPASTSAQAILDLEPDGVFLSNGPGDPDATGRVVLPTLRALLKQNLPLFGICLGHQLLALALGARTVKMRHGHHGANHPVFNIASRQVEITSMNHGFAVDATTLPEGVTESHKSLFDGSNCGLAVEGKPFFSVQYHPEASPGPKDSDYLFDKFIALMAQQPTKTRQAC